MPLPRWLASFNRVVTNRLFAPLAGRVPPWVLVEHTGRRSGRRYRTVVWAFRRDGGLVIVLTYGPRADWVRNVLAAHACRVKWAGRWYSFASAELLDGEPALATVPTVLRPILHLVGVRTTLQLHAS